MTRTEFVKAFAERSGLDAEWADLGFIQVGEKYRLAMPCMCEDASCKGWQMVGPEAAPDIAASLLSELAALKEGAIMADQIDGLRTAVIGEEEGPV